MIAGAHYNAAAKEAYAGNNARGDPRRIAPNDASGRYFGGEQPDTGERNKRRTEADKNMGSESGRPAVILALKTDEPAQGNRQQDTEQPSFNWQSWFHSMNDKTRMLLFMGYMPLDFFVPDKEENNNGQCGY